MAKVFNQKSYEKLGSPTDLIIPEQGNRIKILYEKPRLLWVNDDRCRRNSLNPSYRKSSNFGDFIALKFGRKV